ncbi:LacI family DNA-binding transcriptional regulator [Streptomyces sp. NPDC096152]|uniref:LacI family DNA-binding transcriptional regulator n=1 Tax=Streptomyces sp. NPDC096152 TaxID=3366078 RepID=UPI0038022ABA
MVDVARRAEVSAATVSNVLNRPDTVAERTRIWVETAIVEFGYVRAGQTGEPAAHWNESGPVSREGKQALTLCFGCRGGGI